jgi:hypothetical protein
VPPERATKPYRLLYGLANVFDRFMTSSGYTFADVVTAAEDQRPKSSDAPVGTEARIRAVYADAAEKAGSPVRLLLLRERLADLSSAEFDDALLRLISEPGVFLEPEPKLRSLTDADRKAAVRVGGEDKHLLSIEPS